MDLEDLKEDMIALRADATALAPAVGETLSHIAGLLLEAERVAQQLHASGQAAHTELTELEAERVAWGTQATASRDEVMAAMQALDAALDDQLPLLETSRQELAKSLQETSGSAQTLEQDITAQAPKVAEAEKAALSSLEDLGEAAQRSEDTLKQGVAAARLEAEQLGDSVESGAGEVGADLAALQTTVETLAQQAEATVTNMGTELGRRVSELTEAVLEAVQTTGNGHEAAQRKLDAAVTARLEEWRQATQEAVDSTDTLVHDVDAARQKIERSAGAVDTSSEGLTRLDGILDTVVQEVKDAALTAGLEWIR
jgi:archaellum component FlaC